MGVRVWIFAGFFAGHFAGLSPASFRPAKSPARGTERRTKHRRRERERERKRRRKTRRRKTMRRRWGKKRARTCTSPTRREAYSTSDDITLPMFTELFCSVTRLFSADSPRVNSSVTGLGEDSRRSAALYTDIPEKVWRVGCLWVGERGVRAGGAERV